MKSLHSWFGALFIGALTSSFQAQGAPSASTRPNILWLVCEDSSFDWFGCYGNKQAKTPNIDALAKQGFRYTHVYACAPVCAPSRSTWITGINAVSMGTTPMRSRYNIPHPLIPYYPDSLRAAGYYTANHSKTDYNIGGRPDNACWNSDTGSAWSKRKPGQPFFQVLNFGESHESKAHGDVTQTRHSPTDVTLAKYHPDEPQIRMNYAKYHDAMEDMDVQVGKALAALEQSGAAEDTIVVFNSDHGGVMPRSKRFLYESGLHVPLIVRIPEKFKHLWPAATPGATVERLVSFLDLPKTWLSLAGADIPPAMQGSVFIGPKADPEPEYVFSFRERMDERFDNQRSVRNKQYAYIKNYMPYVAWGQHLDYLWKMVATRAWEDAFKANRTNEVTGRFFQLKPVEELYDVIADPDNVVNLAEKPEHQKTLETMRAQLRSWQLRVHDTGLLPESERERRAAEHNTTVYEMALDPKLYNLPAYLDAADLALEKRPGHTPKLIEALKSPDSGIRYWATVGLLLLSNADSKVPVALETVREDPCSEIRALAAWALLKCGQTKIGQHILTQILTEHSSSTLLALNVLDWAKADLAPHQEAIKAMIEANNNRNTSDKSRTAYEHRMIANLFEANGLNAPPPPKEGKSSE